MGNIGSSNINGRRRHSSSRRGHHHPPPATAPQPPQPEISPNQYVFAAATPYPAAQYNQNPNPNPHPYYHYPGYYPPAMPAPPPLPAPYDHHHRPPPPSPHVYPCGPMMPPPPRYVEHQKAVTIRNDVNLKKESLRVEKDEENPGRFIVSFTFDATVPGSITIMFFAKEGEDCSLTSTKENMLAPVTVPFEQGLGQKFRQSFGTEIDFFSMFDDSELLKEGEMEVYPLVVKAEAILVNPSGSDDNQEGGATNSQITKAVFEKEKGEYQVRVVKQILWVNSIRYELQEIYGIGNSVDNDFDGNDPGKECVICLSEPRDTTVLPCRHMCMCSGCAKLLGFQTNRCPICRQPVERLLEIKVNTGTED